MSVPFPRPRTARQPSPVRRMCRETNFQTNRLDESLGAALRDWRRYARRCAHAGALAWVETGYYPWEAYNEPRRP